ncbi:hypothetical protein yc1106_01061 [Curvularia clavata]|uniref:Uncharacterized protein n=1 Tax=Curvularia clavata TaxID=95742 RepID=A0A9Q8Z141_CURCL|nr:hypothetical protein yc1106_01061 [Curvularia clavata]
MPAAQAPNSPQAQPENKAVRLHITPFRPDLLKVYLAPSVLPLAQNVSYHTVETFPEKGFGYVELPEAEAQKLRKKLNGTILKGSKVRIEMAKKEKRKAREEADAAKEAHEETERPSKRAKKEKKEKKERKKKELGVLEGVELPDDRKVKRGWTEPADKTKKDRKEKKDKKDKKDKEAKKERKHSKYTKEPELLFKAKLTPVAATEVAQKDKKKDKKEKKDKNKSKSTQVVIHEFENNTKTPSFLKQPELVISKKPAVDYVDGKGWVDEDGVVVEPETGKAKARRALELVDAPSEAAKAWIDGTSKPSSSTPKAAKDKKKKATPPPSSSESESEESSVVSSSSEDEDSSASESEESEAEESEAESSPPSPPSAAKSKKTPEATQPAAPAEKEVHPLEALFKRSKPDASVTTPTKKLNPIDTSFTFFDNNGDDAVEINGQPVEDAPITPYTQRDIEWRGLRSAAPTPDTAAIGRRFSFDWRRNSQEIDDDEDMSDLDVDAEQRLSHNTRANASTLAGVAEEDEDAVANADDDEKPESEFRKWFWENRGDLNRAWKKRRRDALKAKRHSENKKMTSGRRAV